MSRIEYFDGWNYDSILAWLQQHNESGKASTLHNDNGYEFHFADGSKYEAVFGSRMDDTPTEIYIDGKLVQRSYD